MAYKLSIKFTTHFDKSLQLIDYQDQKRIQTFLKERFMASDNPHQYAKRLKGNMSKYWSYRIGKYIVIVDIKNHEIMVISIGIGHRKEIYSE
ncbi:MAG: type II toxin-antitoxin system RelE/ParE family toxin [Flavobacteriales bacterium]|nr:type II toxin-antitoxin system RelE/ParE family toxin [Flavobacteriales bacterium]